MALTENKFPQILLPLRISQSQGTADAGWFEIISYEHTQDIDTSHNNGYNSQRIPLQRSRDTYT